MADQAPAALADGWLDGRYELGRRLGQGSCGTVWEAFDHDTGRACAVKQLGSSGAADRRRLAGEFARLASLDHPALPRAYELATATSVPPAAADAFATGTAYFTAELIAGRAPARYLADLASADQPAALVRLAEDVAGALAHLHAAGLLHCDVKPDNLLVEPDGSTRLLDLGSSLTTRDRAATGTPRYMSAEALAGHPSPASDLHALGVSIYELAVGTPPFSGATAADLLRAIVAGDYPRAAERDFLPAPLADLVDHLLAGDFESARALVRQLALVRESLGLPPRAVAVPEALAPVPTVGNGGAVDALLDVFERVAAGRGPSAVALEGAPGAGHRAVFDAALRAEAVGAIDAHRPACGSPLGAADDALAWLDRQVPPTPSPVEWAFAARDVLAERAAARGPFAVFVQSDAESDTATADGRGAALFRVLGAEPSPGAFAVVFATNEVADAEFAGARAAVRALDADEVADVIATMVGRRVADAWSRAVATATGGLAELVAEAVRVAAAREGVDHLERAAADSVCDPATFAAALVARVARLEPDAVAPLEALAVLGGPAPFDAVAATAGATEPDVVATLLDLRALGLVEIGDDRAALPSGLHGRALAGAIPESRARALHRAALAWRREHTPEPEALVPHLLVAGPAAEAAEACLAGAERLAERGRPAQAASFAAAAVERCTGHARTDALLVLARYALACSDYPAAIEAAERAGRSRDGDRRRRARLLLARALQRSGSLERASSVLAGLYDDAPDDESVLAAYARVLVAQARYEKARDVAGAPSSWPRADGPERAARLEAAGLARLYSGDCDGADDLFAVLEDIDGGTHAAKALALRGMAAQTSGEIGAAAALYERAEQRARAERKLHAAAVAAQNRGSALSEQGHHGAALAAYERAALELRRLGADAELAWALYNRASALAALGEVAAARPAVRAAEDQARRAGAPQICIYARILDGEIELRANDVDAAVAAFRDAVALADDKGQPRDRLFAGIGLALARARAGDHGASAGLDDLAGGADASSEDDRHRLALARAQVALALGRPLGDDATGLEAAADAWGARGCADLVWRAHAALARDATARGDRERAAALADRARAELAAIVAATPARYRDGLRRDPDALALSGLVAFRDPPEGESPARADAARLRRLLAVSRRLNSELRLAPLLDEVIDTVIELTGAERGFLLLDDSGAAELSICVARNFEQSALSSDEREVSRSIAERAARTGEVVLTVDAAFDERFDAAASVAALKLRSVLAVPLRQKARVIGTIYADHRFRAGAFDDAAVDLVVELSHVAGAAIHNARLREDNLRRQSEIARLNAELEGEVERKDAELKTARARLPPTEDVGRRYADIVGRSAPMLAMLRLVDRAADSDLPVVIAGESGSGKELVARALHEQGRRAARPFVAVNCGAVSESLLESELFGHVRGAFTGADRNRRGMFEVADGGTLFLDEIADTAPSMQATLLRVLQEGEIRRVGDERTRAVDVRVVAASNQDLRQLVAEGRFREDLFFRLAVLHIDVPPLRDRIDDLPALAEAILHRLAGSGPAPALDRAALARLAGHPWPGNVRELENELARASALADGEIRVEHLSPAVARIDPVARASDRPVEDLRIKPRVEALERLLVDEAMSRTGGNQTAAARLLGLSRYGLQKKLKRYGIAGLGETD